MYDYVTLQLTMTSTSESKYSNIPHEYNHENRYIPDINLTRNYNINSSMIKSLPHENFGAQQMVNRSPNHKNESVPSPVNEEIKLLTNNLNYDNMMLNKLLQEQNLLERNNSQAYTLLQNDNSTLFDKKIDEPNFTMQDVFANKIVNPENNLFRDEKSLISQLLNSFIPLKISTPKLHFFSRKVFVGGLPPDCDEEEIAKCFRQFGPLIVDWPHKADSKSQFPPKGYCFLLFQDEISVKTLIESCVIEDGKYFWCVTSSSFKEKPVQIRPWNLSDADYVMNAAEPLDLRKTIFVGGVPRPLRAVELAFTMDKLYGGVCYAGIDTDPELKYPKGAGRVSFSNQKSYIAAISAKFVQLQFGDIDKKVEVKPYVLDDQLCDECQGARSNGLPAPYFCANVTCLQYYCEACWAIIHSKQGRQYHKPLVKEGAERTRSTASIFL